MITMSSRTLLAIAIGGSAAVAAVLSYVHHRTTVTAASTPITIVDAATGIGQRTATGRAAGSDPTVATGDGPAAHGVGDGIATASAYPSTAPNRDAEQILERLQQQDHDNIQRMIVERREMQARTASTPAPGNPTDDSRHWAP